MKGKTMEKTKTLDILDRTGHEGECCTCKHVGDAVDICILRKCVNAVPYLNNCYEPREEVAHWVNNQNGTYTCDHCGEKHSKSKYCPSCGFKMAADVEEKKNGNDG